MLVRQRNIQTQSRATNLDARAIGLPDDVGRLRVDGLERGRCAALGLDGAGAREQRHSVPPPRDNIDAGREVGLDLPRPGAGLHRDRAEGADDQAEVALLRCQQRQHQS